jgi:hypothetical protein
MVFARVSLSKYGNKVLNVVKAKFDLNDKSEALNKFLDIYGDEFVEKEAKEDYIKKVISIEENHLRKYGKRKMSLRDLDKLCEE